MTHRLTALLALFVLALTLQVAAQDATPEPTAEPTADATGEPTAEPTAEGTPSATCPEIVRSAISVTEQACAAIGTDEICYGHLVLSASARDGVPEFTFVAPGDVVDVVDMQSLRLNAMDVERGVWGVVLMRVPSDPNDPESEPMSILLFGDVDLSTQIQFVPVIAAENVNIRSQPQPNAEILQVLQAEQTITANGRAEIEGVLWLRVRVTIAQTDAEQNQIGWLRADLVEPADGSDLTALAEVDPADNTDLDASYGPMQAFSFQSGSDDAPCAEAPNSGIMVQTPEGVASVRLWMDEVVIDLSGTAFVQSQAGGELTVNTVEGEATVSANGESSTAVAGTSVSVEMGEDGTAASAPSDPVPFDTDDVQALPVDLLDRPVDVPEPRELRPGEPIPGDWRFAWGVNSLTCDDGTVVPLTTTGETGSVRMDEDGNIQWNSNVFVNTEGKYVFNYVDSLGNLHQQSLTVSAPDRIDGLDVIDFAAITCTIEAPFSLQLVSAAE
jgi:hypothetical protein